MKTTRLFIPAMAGLLVSSMAFGQNISTINQNKKFDNSFVAQGTRGQSARLMAHSAFRFNLGAYDPVDSMRIYQEEGKNNIWSNSNPYAITDINQMNAWDEVTYMLMTQAYRYTDTLINYFWSPSLMNWDVEDRVEITDIVGDSAKVVARTRTENNASIMEFDERYYEYYDINGNLGTVMMEEWDGSAWQPSMRYSALKNAAGIDSCGIVYSYDGSAWMPVTKREVMYNAESQVAMVNDYLYNGSEWEDQGMYTYTYNAAGNMLTNVYSMPINDSTWQDSYQIVYTYNSADQCVQKEMSTYNGTSWDESNKEIYDYNAEGLLASKIFQYYNGSVYENNYKQEFMYDDGMLEYYDNHNWDGSMWVASTRVNIENNIDENEGTIVQWEQNWNAGNFLELVNGNMKETFYFEAYTPSAIKSLDKSMVSIYPNPATDNLNIKVDGSKIEAVQVYSITGALIMNVTQVQQSHTNIDMSQLQSGLYNVVIKTKEGMGSFKVSVLK